MLSVTKMYDLMAQVLTDLNYNDFDSLSYDLTHHDSSYHDTENYVELYKLYHSYHAFLDIESCANIRKDVPDETYWKELCGIFYNWKIGDSEFCVTVKDVGIKIQIGKVVIPAFMITFSHVDKAILVAPRIFPYSFVIPHRFEHQLDATSTSLKIFTPDKCITSKVIKVAQNNDAYFKLRFGLCYNDFIILLSESLRRMHNRLNTTSGDKVIDLREFSATHRKIKQPHFRNGHTRQCRSGKIAFIRPTWVKPQL